MRHVYLTLLLVLGSLTPGWNQSDPGLPADPSLCVLPVVPITPEKGFGTRPQASLWPGNIVPYEILETEFTPAEKAQIEAAIAYLNTNTNLCMLPRTFEADYIEVASSGGNFNSASSVGFRGGIHRATFATNEVQRMYLHEFCHLFGLYHEHQRPDRDSFITVVLSNVPREFWPQFERYPPSTIDYYWSETYDFGSVMHYAPNAFGRSGLPTIQPRDSAADIPLDDTLSSIDIATLQQLYPDRTDCDSLYREQILDGSIEFTDQISEICRDRLVEVRFVPTQGNPADWDFTWKVPGGEVVSTAGPVARVRMTDLRAQRVTVRIQRGSYTRTYEDFIFVVDPEPRLEILGNPVGNDQIAYRFTSANERVSLRLVDAMGRSIHAETITVPDCGTEGSIGCEECPPGLYILFVLDGKERFSRRIRIN